MAACGWLRRRIAVGGNRQPIDRALPRRRADAGVAKRASRAPVGGDIRTVLLVPETVEAQARSLALALRMDWTHKPLSRCLVDNVALLPASEEPSPPAEMGARTGWSLSDLPQLSAPLLAGQLATDSSRTIESIGAREKKTASRSRDALSPASCAQFAAPEVRSLARRSIHGARRGNGSTTARR